MVITSGDLTVNQAERTQPARRHLPKLLPGIDFITYRERASLIAHIPEPQRGGHKPCNVSRILRMFGKRFVQRGNQAKMLSIRKLEKWVGIDENN